LFEYTNPGLSGSPQESIDSRIRCGSLRPSFKISKEEGMKYTIKVYMNYPYGDIVGVEMVDGSDKQIAFAGIELGVPATSFTIQSDIRANVLFNTLAQGL
jgi:hypothetical protein